MKITKYFKRCEGQLI